MARARSPNRDKAFEI
ncbi:hypothetical protein H8J72_03715 [Clostridium perfringens]|nr:hypothetical protein [Clostridium perfringens]